MTSSPKFTTAVTKCADCDAEFIACHGQTECFTCRSSKSGVSAGMASFHERMATIYAARGMDEQATSARTLAAKAVAR